MTIRRLAIAIAQFVFLLTAFAPLALLAQNDTSKKFTVFYSGRMLGYLREDSGTPTTPTANGKCKQVWNTTPYRLSDSAQSFLNSYACECEKLKAAGKATDRCMLLGMGDNFAPKYESRLDDAGTGFKSRNSNNISYDQDNVARFLKFAQFDAIVPGKEDFYFGAYRLWKIGKTLNDEPVTAANPHVTRFIADNLVLRPANEKNREPYTDNKKKFTDKADWISTSFAGKAMPWLSKLTFKLDHEMSVGEARNLVGKLCASIHNPDDIDPGNCLNQKLWTVKIPTPGAGKTSVDEVSFTRADGSLEPGKDYGFCVEKPPASHPQQIGANSHAAQKTKPAKTYCVPIHIEVPLFNVPYVVAKDGATEVVIFAVVDEDLPKYVPHENVGWDVSDGKSILTKSKEESRGQWLPHRIEVATLPPEVALQQAMDAFTVDRGLDSTATIPNQSDIPTLMLAQMDYSSAAELNVHLAAPRELELTTATTQHPAEAAFDLVLARAESAHQTRPETRVLTDPQESRPRFVAVPPPAWVDKAETEQVPLGWATVCRNFSATTNSVGPSYCGQSNSTGREAKVDFFVATNDPPPQGSSVTSAAWGELLAQINLAFSTSKLQASAYSACYLAAKEEVPEVPKPKQCSPDDGTLSKCILKFAECAMMSHSKSFDTEGADLAFLQPHDVFVPKKAYQTHLAQATSVQEILDRIFWRNDFLSFENLSGSQLKNLIKQGTKIDKTESSPVWILRDTKDLGLRYSGIVPGKLPKPGSKDDTAYAHRDELSDTAIYRVAASSYLETGQTVYADFATPAVDKPQVFHDGKGVRVSVLVCEALIDAADINKHGLYHCGQRDPQSLKQISQTDYAVNVAQTKAIGGMIVTDNREQQDASEYLEAQLSELVNPRAPFMDKSDKAAKAEYEIQNYPYLDVYLEKLSFGGSLNTALASRATTAKFSGVQSSDIPQPTKSEFNWDTKGRALRRWRRLDLGAAIDEQFDKSVQGDLTKPSIPTWTRNSLTVGPLFQISISPPRTTPRTLIAMHLDYIRQIANTSLSLSGAPGSAPIASPKLLASQGYQPRVGLRYESGDSYFESGFVRTTTYNVLNQVAGLPNGAVCNLSQQQTLKSCIDLLLFLAGTSAPTLHYSTFSQNGLYWDGKLSLEILKDKWTYQLDSHGNFLPSGATVSALTRFDITLGNSLKFPLIGNLSLVPKAEWRFFENQGTQDFLKRINTSLSLTYDFHKDSRVRLWDAMRYKSSASSK